MNARMTMENPQDGTVLASEVLVIGSGAGGSAVAGELRRKGRNVLLVEAGPAEAGGPAAHLTDRGGDSGPLLSGYDHLVVQANAKLPVPGVEGARSFHGPGGLMTRWAGVTPRPHLVEEWDGTVDPDLMAGLLTEAELLLNSTPTDKFRDAEAPLHDWVLERLWKTFGGPGNDDAARVVNVAARVDDEGAIRYTGADALLHADESALSLVSGYVVTEILHDGTRATGARARQFDGTGEIRIDADVVVVAAGALATPQLLVASGMDTSPALGRNLMDHLMLFFERFDVSGQDVPVRGAAEPIVSIGLPVGPGRPYFVTVQDALAQYSVSYHDDPVAPRELGVGIFVGTEPVWENRLVFDAERPDPFGLPCVAAEIELTGADRARVGAALALGYQVCAALGNVWGTTNLQFGGLGSSLHLMGTYRMGADPRTSVADPECRLWGWDNVYVAGNGVIGWRNSVNPTLTTVALGLHAARAIVGRKNEAEAEIR